MKYLLLIYMDENAMVEIRPVLEIAGLPTPMQQPLKK